MGEGVNQRKWRCPDLDRGRAGSASPYSLQNPFDGGCSYRSTLAAPAERAAGRAGALGGRAWQARRRTRVAPSVRLHCFSEVFPLGHGGAAIRIPWSRHHRLRLIGALLDVPQPLRWCCSMWARASTISCRLRSRLASGTQPGWRVTLLVLVLEMRARPKPPPRSTLPRTATASGWMPTMIATAAPTGVTAAMTARSAGARAAASRSRPCWLTRQSSPPVQSLPLTG